MCKSFVVFLLFFLLGCASSPIHRHKMKAAKIIDAIIQQLEDVETLPDLQNREKILEKYFVELVDTMIAQKKLEKSRGKSIEEFSYEDFERSENLRQEMIRIYRMEGGRELIEKMEQKAMLKLDWFYQKMHHAPKQKLSASYRN